MAINVGWGSQWETLANAINSYYGGGVQSAQYQKVVNYLNSGNYTKAEMESILKQIPDFERTYNQNGELISVSYKQTASTAKASNISAGNINSNVTQSTTASSVKFKEVQKITTNAQTGKASIGNTLTKWRGGVPSTGTMLISSVVSGVLAVGAGGSLGKTIASTLYNANPDFWDSHNMSTLDPSTWRMLTEGDTSLGASLINTFLDIDPNTGNPTMYINDDLFAYMALYMQQNGIFGETKQRDLPSGDNYDNPALANVSCGSTSGWIIHGKYSNVEFTDTYTMSHGVNCAVFSNDYPPEIEGDTGSLSIYCASTTPFTITRSDTGTTVDAGSFTRYNETIYYYSIGINYVLSATGLSAVNNPEPTISDDDYYRFLWSLAGATTSDKDGVTDQDGAILPQLDNSMSVADAKSALQEQYPDLWDNRAEYQPTSEDPTQVYIPITIPTGGTGNQPTNEGATQTDPTADISGNGDNATNQLIELLIELIAEIRKKEKDMPDEKDTPPDIPSDDPNGDDTGTGDTPTTLPPTGSASALWRIYNPSQSQLNDFGAWLWSSDFVDQLLKVFSDPMQAIIGLHKIFVNPPVSGSGAIKVGYLTSNASANYVSGQYVDVDCGTVNVTEVFGNVFDYNPFTKIHLYLPFVGIVQLDTASVMRGKMSIVYHVDVLTGTCLAEVKITRDLGGGVMYTYAGNCAVQYPVSSGSYVGVITGLLGIAGGIAGTIASGGALAPAVMGLGASVGGMHTDVRHSGSIGANAGAMGVKKPYLIFERPQTATPENGDVIEGRPQNKIVTLSSLKGFVKVKKCHYDGISCTSNELDMIKGLLEKGIFIN